MMYNVKVNNHFDYNVEFKANEVTLNDVDFIVNSVQLSKDHYHIIHNNLSYSAEVASINLTEKKATIKISGNTYNLTAKDQFDSLLEQLGMSNLNTAKVMDVKAPMPGLVLKVLVNEGDEVKKGDNLFVLEAMKMENMIKAPADAIVKSVKIQPTDKVEKGQLLIVFK